MTISIQHETSKRRTEPRISVGRGIAESLVRLVVVLASLGAFLLSQLVFNQGVAQQTPDILVVKQIDAEEVKLKDEGKSQSDMGVVSDSISMPSFDERQPLVQGQSGFQFERLLCLGSRGPPQG